MQSPKSDSAAAEGSGDREQSVGSDSEEESQRGFPQRLEQISLSKKPEKTWRERERESTSSVISRRKAVEESGVEYIYLYMKRKSRGKKMLTSTQTFSEMSSTFLAPLNKVGRLRFRDRVSAANASPGVTQK